MQRTCSTLSRAGFEVLLVGRKLDNQFDSSRFNFETHRIECFFNSGKLFYFEFNIRVFFYLLFQRFQVICAVDLDTILPAFALAKIKGVKLGYDAHEYFQEVPEVVGRSRIKKFWESVARYTIPKTNFRYTVSQKIADQFYELYHVPFEVVRNVPYYKPPIKVQTKNPYLLYQGALNDGRGLEELIRASIHLPVKVKIAGEGDLSESLRKLATELNCQDKVEFLGFIMPTALREVTENAFVGYNVLANKGLSYYYSLANKFFDYTMAGIPCLVSEFPEYISLHEKFGIGIYCKLSEADIIREVNRLFSEEEYYEALRHSAWEAAKSLNWSLEKEKLIGLFEDEQ
jgi:glycosyltransferase involved in cell wall biosynthesis